MPFDFVPVEMLDPASGTDGQVPVLSGGRFVIGDQSGSGSPLTVKDEGADVETATVSMDFVGDIEATTDGSGHVTITVTAVALVPLTTVVDGEPTLVWDTDNQLLVTEYP